MSSLRTGAEPGASASLTRSWFSCSNWSKDCSAGPRGELWSWEEAALGEAGVLVLGDRCGHGQGLHPELGAFPCLGDPCSLPECRGQAHSSLASICPCLAPAGSCGLCLCISPSSLAIKPPGTSLPTLGLLPPASGAGKVPEDSTESVELRGTRQGHLTNPWQGESRHPLWLLEVEG